MNPHPPEVRDRVRELRVMGARTAEICEVCNVSRAFVFAATRDLPAPPRRDAIPAEQVAQIAEMYLCDVPVDDIARLVGVSRWAVLHYARKRGLEKRLGTPKATIERIRRLREQGKGITAIARVVGVSRKTVRQYLVGAPEVLQKPANAMSADRIEVMRVMRANGKSISAIARALKTCRKVVRKYLAA